MWGFRMRFAIPGGEGEDGWILVRGEEAVTFYWRSPLQRANNLDLYCRVTTSKTPPLLCAAKILMAISRKHASEALFPSGLIYLPPPLFGLCSRSTAADDSFSVEPIIWVREMDEIESGQLAHQQHKHISSIVISVHQLHALEGISDMHLTMSNRRWFIELYSWSRFSAWADIRVRKSKNFPDSKIFTKKTFRIKCVNRDINDFATNASKT